jgi:dTDP-4-dehydrorhamnose reductase
LVRAEVDLTDFPAVERLFAHERPSGVIHCAARSRSPACQADPAGARLQNVEVTRRLAELAAEVPMVFLSTDLVFDGRRDGSKGGYQEGDAVNPLSVYAETKVEAEAWVRRNPRHAIVRTSLNFGRSPSGPGAFNEELAAAWRAGRVVDLFVDEFRCPIAAVETARRLWALLDSGQGGVFHLAGSERLSRYDIGQLVAEDLRRSEPGLAMPMRAGSLAGYSGAPRAPDTTLDGSRLAALLGEPMPAFTPWLRGGDRG